LFSYGTGIFHAAYLVVEAMYGKLRHQVSEGAVCVHPIGVAHSIGAVEL
jgi:hypothetical protein